MSSHLVRLLRFTRGGFCSKKERSFTEEPVSLYPWADHLCTWRARVLLTIPCNCILLFWLCASEITRGCSDGCESIWFSNYESAGQENRRLHCSESSRDPRVRRRRVREMGLHLYLFISHDFAFIRHLPSASVGRSVAFNNHTQSITPSIQMLHFQVSTLRSAVHLKLRLNPTPPSPTGMCCK